MGKVCVLIGCHVSSSDCADTRLATCRLLIVPTLGLLRVESWLADGDFCRVASKSPGEACVLIGCHVSSSDCADTLLLTCHLLIVPTLFLLRVKSWWADGDLCRVASKSPGEVCVLIGCHVSSSNLTDTRLATCRLLIVPTLCLLRVRSWVTGGDLCRVVSKSPVRRCIAIINRSEFWLSKSSSLLHVNAAMIKASSSYSHGTSECGDDEALESLQDRAGNGSEFLGVYQQGFLQWKKTHESAQETDVVVTTLLKLEPPVLPIQSWMRWV
ncbi:hypothetical protein F2Q69_00028043 [Brassica cretica]|uniref:Uncharacterized protein n=1 Tax=Brassica cretica TaxID=69181 RepID=A0A8S9S570_BRACR|nr:hypothetical protein F2Q69_00028043 [Brassica cretica]